MKGATSIQERLWELRKDKGLNLEELSELTGISKSALGSYEKEDYKEINHGNLITLADFYGVSVDYLLCRTENREQINTPLTELHLNDEMVALLKSGRINNRLLCELATHKDFIKFLADIEIYVDGIATMQIQNLNALVDTVRHEIIERYRPGEDDPHLKVLQAAHISDDEYFSHMVLDDLNLIIRKRSKNSRVVGMKSWSSLIASNSVSTIKICRKKNSAGSFGFSKNQRKWERLSARGKNGNKKPLLHGCVSFHVAAVYAVVIQLKFQKDRLEFMNLMPLPMINIFLSFS